jgi:multicomponent Na+:H+ antiporter subunit D
MIETPSALAATAGGYWLVLAILLPVAGILASFALGGRLAERIALGLTPIGLTVTLVITVLVWRSGAPLVYNVAGLPPPLGIALRADGISCVMLVTAALVIAAAGLFARANFATPPGATEARGPFAFWIMLQAVWSALTILFVGGDLFNLYVALELLTFAAVPLVCLDGRPETLVAALRYLMFALFGSVFYLLGAALLYGAYGTLDLVLLAERVQALPAVWLAAGLMTAGLLAKTALFPLHLWLPPAHANAPPAASAVLSGLVVKGSFFLTVRLWFYVLPALSPGAVGAVLGTLGSAAILFGSVLALRQQRLKLLIAYSTLAQIGYLFLIFPLASGAHPWIADGWGGGIMQTLSHAFAKAAMFLSAGLLAESLGHDRIAEFAGAGRAMPVTFFALGLGGLSLMGLPPSGGFAAKWLLLRASVAAGQWPWAVVMLAGGLLAAGYVYRILVPALSHDPAILKASPRRGREAVALSLAIVAIVLGFAPQSFYDFLQIGRAAASTALP